MRVGVIGTGHVGLPTAVSLAHLGHEVTATDAAGEVVDLLTHGRVPFYEPGLEDLLRAVLETGRLSFTHDPTPVIRGARVVFICVGTPPEASGEANLLAVERAGKTIAQHAVERLVVVEKSTVPAGTAERLAETLARERKDVEFLVVCNPEFLREGNAVEDSLRPSRILVGSDAPEALPVMRELYASVVASGVPLLETDLRTAELAKHASNAFLAMKISFANALARICERAGADVVAVSDAMGADPRIGRAHLSAGLGYGGYCFPKDLSAFRRLTERLGYDLPLLAEIARINEEAIDAAFHKIEDALWQLRDKRIALLGLAFKPDSDDVRFSPALALARRLLAAGARVVGYDPQAGGNAKAEIPELEVVADVESALDGADCAVICTEWEEFGRLEPARIRELLADPVVVDGRNVFEPEAMRRAGFTYLPTGRPPVRPE